MSVSILPTDRGLRSGVGLLGILIIAANLRVSFVSVGPLLEDISNDVGLSGAQAGLLTGLPLLAFALFSPLAPGMARIAGLDRASWLSMFILAVGIVLRSLELPGMIWVGTVLIGAGIAFLNVLVPSLVKRQFPSRVSQVTGFYTSIQGAAAALGAAFVVPVAQVTPLGWRLSLGLWVGLALVALAVLLPKTFRRESPPSANDSRSRSARSPWRTLLGWQVTLFMGFQSLTYYVFGAWLPTIERTHGVSETTAGLHMALFLLVGMGASLGTGILMGRMADQRIVGLTGSLLALTAFLGLALAPDLMLLWVISAALACGCLIVVALSLFSLRTDSPRQAARLSGMAQSGGYAIASVGPLAFGLLHDATGGFELPLLLSAGCMVVLCLLAVLVGRSRTIG